ncbi:MAG: HlyD family secretion protein, partial [Rhodospirillales bacterium]|nr:HlyD family secretion protein [Rhodospirillales bacterium]
MSDDTTIAAPRRRGWGRILFRLTLFVVGPVVGVFAAGYFYVTGGRLVTTDNAYVKADLIAVTTDVSGRVAEVAVAQNDAIEAGRILFRLDDEPFRIALQRAEAELSAARQQVKALRAQYRQKGAELKITNDDVEYYAAAYERSRKLKDKGIVSQAKFDEARLKLRTARQRVAALGQEIAGVVANLGGNAKLPAARHPAVRAAAAARDQAALDLKHTTVRSPTAAIVTKMRLQAGEYVEAGTPVFSLVATKTVWIEANLKETDLTHLRIGQPASVRVDTYPDRAWSAVVASISPATGAEFALLPAQNSSGNWVKVVQRLPVRLELRTGPNDPPLRAGMSAAVEIDTGHE